MRDDSTIRILVPGDDLYHDSIKTGIQLAAEISKKYSSEVDEVILFIPSKQNIKHSSLTSALGQSVADNLHKGNSVQLPTGIPMRLETIRTLRGVYKSSVILAIYADQKMMDQIDPMHSLKAIIAVPYAPDALVENQRVKSSFLTEFKRE